MLRPHVLKSVSEPSKRLFARPNALLISGLAGMLLFPLHPFLGILGFLLMHSLMAFLTARDPYFFDVWWVYLHQKKLRKGEPYVP